MCEKPLRKLYLNTSKSNLTLAYDEGLGQTVLLRHPFSRNVSQKKKLFTVVNLILLYTAEIST